MINYTKFMSHNPTAYGEMVNTKGQTITFYEHTIKGDESEVICVCHELRLSDYSTFFETEDMMAEHGEYEPWFDEQGELQIG